MEAVNASSVRPYPEHLIRVPEKAGDGIVRQAAHAAAKALDMALPDLEQPVFDGSRPKGSVGIEVEGGDGIGGEGVVQAALVAEADKGTGPGRQDADAAAVGAQPQLSAVFGKVLDKIAG